MNPAPVIDVTVRDGMLTLHAVDAPLADILTAIGVQAGIDIALSGNLSATVSRSFTNVSVPEAVRGLARGALLVMIHGPAVKDSRGRRVTEIRVYGSAGGNAPKVVMALSRPKLEPGVSASHTSTSDVSDAAVTAALQRYQQYDEAGRRTIILGLSARGDPEAVAILGRIISQDSQPAVRNAAVAALLKIGDEQAVTALQSGLGDKDFEVRNAVVGALGELGGEQALMGLGQVLFAEKMPDLRLRAVEQLSLDPSEPARALLQAAARGDQDPNVREAARRALGLQ